MKGSSKTAYEIRSDLLHLAFEILHGRAVAAAYEKAKVEGGEPIIIAPTTEDVIKEAQVLNVFVSVETDPKRLTGQNHS